MNGLLDRIAIVAASLESQFRWDHLEYFRTLVLLIVVAWGQRNMASLYRHLDSRSRIAAGSITFSLSATGSHRSLCS